MQRPPWDSHPFGGERLARLYLPPGETLHAPDALRACREQMATSVKPFADLSLLPLTPDFDGEPS